MKTFNSFVTRVVAHQRVALRHHCRLGIETAHPRFQWMDGDASIVLTVNTGYE